MLRGHGRAEPAIPAASRKTRSGAGDLRTGTRSAGRSVGPRCGGDASERIPVSRDRVVAAINHTGSPHSLGPWSVMQAALQDGAATSRPSVRYACGRTPLPCANTGVAISVDRTAAAARSLNLDICLSRQLTRYAGDLIAPACIVDEAPPGYPPESLASMLCVWRLTNRCRRHSQWSGNRWSKQ